MKRCIRVECWADCYFFGKLLQNEIWIRKEKNKEEVIKSIKERAADTFAVGIVDSDNNPIEPFLKGFAIEEKFFVCQEIELVKFEAQPHYLIILHPKEFEKWIVRFLESTCKKALNDFHYNTYKSFEDDTKELLPKILNNEKLMKLFKFVLIEQEKSENHVSKLKRILDYLIAHQHAADINELKNA